MTTMEDWKSFLRSLTRPPWDFGQAHIWIVTQLWESLNDRVGGTLPLPLTQSPLIELAAQEGYINLSWERGVNYVDIDVHSDGRLNWFFRNRQTEEVAGTEDPIRDVPQELIEKLKLILPVDN